MGQHYVCLSVCSTISWRVSLAAAERSRSRVASRTRCSRSCCHVIASNPSTTQTNRAPTTALPTTLRGDNICLAHSLSTPINCVLTVIPQHRLSQNFHWRCTHFQVWGAKGVGSGDGGKPVARKFLSCLVWNWHSSAFFDATGVTAGSKTTE